MRLQLFLYALAVTFLVGCNDQNNNAGNNNEAATTSISIDSFAAFFPETNLPFAIPNVEAGQGSRQLSNEHINYFFAHSGYKPAFGNEKDVPDLAENQQSAKYFAEGIFHTDGYTALIIRKTDAEDTYYYLSTLYADGKFIDGTCIALTIGNEVERIASLNDDYSIQIRQTEKSAEEATQQDENTFLSISEDGQIKPINSDNPKVPA